MHICCKLLFFCVLFCCTVLFYVGYLLNNLHLAAVHNDIVTAKVLLGLNVIAVDDIWIDDDESSATPLQTAIHHGNIEFIKFVLDRGANVNGVHIEEWLDPSVHISNRPPLLIAVSMNRLDIMEILLNAGADVNILADAYPCWHLSPLHEAVVNGTVEVVTRLIAAGSDVNSFCHCLTKYNKSPLYLAAENGRADILRLLLEHQAKLDSSAKDQTTGVLSTPMQAALDRGHRLIAQILLREGANPEPYIYEASRAASFDMINDLLDSHVNAGRLLLAAVGSKNSELVHYLIYEKGAQMNFRGPSGLTALHLACLSQSTDILRILLSASTTDINIRSNRGQTPLHVAASLSRSAEVETLLQAGADVDAADNMNITALYLSVEQGREESAIHLVEHGASLLVKGQGGTSLLHLVALGGTVGIAEYLLHSASHQGINIIDFLNVLDNNQQTPLDLAVKSNNLPVAHVYVMNGAHSESAETVSAALHQHHVDTHSHQVFSALANTAMEESRPFGRKFEAPLDPFVKVPRYLIRDHLSDPENNDIYVDL